MSDLIDLSDFPRSTYPHLTRGSTLHSQRGAPWGLAQAAAMMLSGVLCILPIGAHALAENVTKSKEYAATKTDSIIELYAMDVLWTAESNWRVKAVNGTHFGICQGKSKYLKTANYKQQIDWCYRYAINRYGSMVDALYHWKVKGWH